MVREGVPLELNEFDVYAVTAAIRLREANGGEVVTMTMGPPQAEEVLRMTLAMGADRAIHLSDRVFAVADTLGTSRTLALAVAKEGADLVLCGRKTVDSETWQVPPETGAFLGWEQLTSVDRLELVGRAPPRAQGDRRGLRHVRARPAGGGLGRRGDQRGHLAAKRDLDATDTDGRIETWTATRPRRRRRGRRQALRPDRLAHARPRRQGRDPGAPRRGGRNCRGGRRAGRRDARGGGGHAAVRLGEASPARREARAEATTAGPWSS